MLSKGGICGFLAGAASYIHIVKINRIMITEGLGFKSHLELGFFPSSHLMLCISMILYFKTSSLRRLTGCISDTP